MPIERRAPKKQIRRKVSDLMESHERIRVLLGMEKTPTHTLTWKETRLDLQGGDCLPLIDVIEKIAVVLAGLLESEMHYQAQKAKPKIVKKGK